MRRVPIGFAKTLGNTTAKYRWFAVVYLVSMFFLLPGLVFALSVAGTNVLIGVGAPLFVVAALVAIINVLQNKRPGLLPPMLRTWNFLPLCMHSLQPYHNVLMKVCWVCKCCMKEPQVDNDDDVKEMDTTVETTTTHC